MGTPLCRSFGVTGEALVDGVPPTKMAPVLCRFDAYRRQKRSGRALVFYARRIRCNIKNGGRLERFFVCGRRRLQFKLRLVCI
ncbi:hypothetical protein NDU88_004465 [Pleurodeles waltl]|uniref:Uncharacterized protein n=1 Tax=Pleurodeles waltl TaxID=8319 RepID=A0AAV7SIU7_PLEWA|nr:hypothetical protein NDU88_004465 [Pleurodeles waltl]